jgi:hypothetical protein
MSSTKPLVIGTPATFARSLARKQLLHTIYASATVVIGLLVIINFKMPILLLLLLPPALLARYSFGKYKRIYSGVTSERRVARQLKKMSPAVTIHGGDLGAGGDVDHIILGPICAVIETKTGRGRASIKGSDFYVSSKKLHRNPITQIKLQQKLLAKRISCSVEAIVCIVDLHDPPKKINGVWVCSLKDLCTVVSSLPRVLTGSASNALVPRICGNKK